MFLIQNQELVKPIFFGYKAPQVSWLLKADRPQTFEGGGSEKENSPSCTAELHNVFCLCSVCRLFVPCVFFVRRSSGHAFFSVALWAMLLLFGARCFQQRGGFCGSLGPFCWVAHREHKSANSHCSLRRW